MKNRWGGLLVGLCFLLMLAIACAPVGVTGTPQPPAQTICAIVWTPYYSSESNYLGVAPGGRCVNALVLIIEFVDPVESITLSFSGAQQNYVLEAYDEAGSLLGKEIQSAEFNNGAGTLFEISYTSTSPSINRIQFYPSGNRRAVIAIKRISFILGGLESNFTFEYLPDGMPITADTQDSEGRMWHGLMGNEFSAWGFLVSTDLDMR